MHDIFHQIKLEETKRRTKIVHTKWNSLQSQNTSAHREHYISLLWCARWESIHHFQKWILLYLHHIYQPEQSFLKEEKGLGRKRQAIKHQLKDYWVSSGRQWNVSFFSQTTDLCFCYNPWKYIQCTSPSATTENRVKRADPHREGTNHYTYS